MMLMVRLFFVILSAVLVGGCASTVKVNLAEARVVEKTYRQIGITGESDKINRKIEVIQFDITSKNELHNFFNIVEQKPIQVLCRAEGAKRTENLANFGFGPYHGETNISKLLGPESSTVIEPMDGETEYRYSVYAFVGLKAGYTQIHNGVPETALNLKSEEFERLSCYMRGFTYPPAPKPRTNSFGIEKEHFLKMLNTYRESANN